MKRVVLILAFAVSTSLIFAQGSEQDSAMIRKEKRKAEIEKQYQLTKEMVENKNFVLESNFLQNRYGDRFWVSPTINFVKVEPDNKAVIQIGSNWRFGPNGVGGVTAKGRITHWKVSQNKKSDTFNVIMNVMTPIGIYDVNFSIMPGGHATALLTGISGDRLTFEGDLVPTSDTSTYEGWSIG